MSDFAPTPRPAPLLDPAALAAIRDELEAKGERLVFTNGCFDLLHVGHVRYLQAARALGERLVVAVNGDASVRRLKGPQRPLNPQQERAEVIAALGCVDYVTIFEETRVDQLLRTIRPQIYAKGGDYTPETLDPQERAALEEVGAQIALLPLVPGRSTTALLAAATAPAPEKKKLKIAVIGSGKGSNFAAIAREIDAGRLPLEVAIVVSDHAEAGILELARERGYRARALPPSQFKTKLEPELEEHLTHLLEESGADLIVLAGYMRLVKAPLLERFAGRIINIHPSLLPEFPGLAAWEQALKAGKTRTGCTVHYVDAGMDTGPVIAQREVPILPDDTAASLHARIQEAEHQLYPAVLARLADEHGK